MRRSLQRLRPLLLLLSLLALFHSARGADCSCYLATGGSRNATYTNYTFLDYRSIGQVDSHDFANAPALDPFTKTQSNLNVTSAYFNSTDFIGFWTIQNWTQNASTSFPVEQVNAPQNVYIMNDADNAGSTYLTLRSARLPEFQSVGEVDSAVSNMVHASIRIRSRIRGAEGAVAGMFLYADDDNESDIEILTADNTSEFRATNQPSVDAAGNLIPDSSSIARIPSTSGSGLANGSWQDWTDWRLDWLDDRVDWLVNGRLVVSKTYGVPKKPAYFVMNVWSNGGTWSGNMSVGDNATMDVAWVEMVYNTTGLGANQHCHSMCVVDDINSLGQPVQVSAAWRLTSLVLWLWPPALTVCLWLWL